MQPSSSRQLEREADVVVVEAGNVGCATAYHLARRGVRAVLVERGTVAGDQSRKNWGFVRQQGCDPLELPLMMESNRPGSARTRSTPSSGRTTTR